VAQPETRTLDVPGAVLHYDVRESGASTAPILLMIGSPMDASGFASLTGHFRDRTVVTHDPAGSGGAGVPTTPASPRQSSTPTTCAG
jgi:hypothetical protein